MHEDLFVFIHRHIQGHTQGDAQDTYKDTCKDTYKDTYIPTFIQQASEASLPPKDTMRSRYAAAYAPKADGQEPTLEQNTGASEHGDDVVVFLVYRDGIL